MCVKSIRDSERKLGLELELGLVRVMGVAHLERDLLAHVEREHRAQVVQGGIEQCRRDCDREVVGNVGAQGT